MSINAFQAPWSMLCCLFLSPQIHPEEEDYGFEIEEKNKAIVVKSVTRGSHAEVRSLHTHTHTDNTHVCASSFSLTESISPSDSGAGGSVTLLRASILSVGIRSAVLH